jgi:hypothetical protein
VADLGHRPASRGGRSVAVHASSFSAAVRGVELDFGAGSGDFAADSMGIAMKKLILIAALLAPTGVLADSGSDGANAKRGEQMVCRPIKETGSRLSKKRICMTREQWAEQKRIMRTDLNQAQTRRNEPTSN